MKELDVHQLAASSAISQKHRDSLPVRLKADLYLERQSVQALMNLMPFCSGERGSRFARATLPHFVKPRLPDLWKLAQTIRGLLQKGDDAIIIESLPFAKFELNKSKGVLLALASCIGRPISADPYRNSLVWEVSTKLDVSHPYTPTITEHNGSAELHTDSSFKVSPEDYVLMFAHRPASDGGGLSRLVSATSLLEKLAETDLGRECIRLLHLHSFPFRVPTVFTRHRRDSDLEWIAAPILSDYSKIRYRADLIDSALEHIPTSLPSEAEWALRYFDQQLQEMSPSAFALKQGHLLVLNNHRFLHGRTAFEDRNRMLLRVRLARTHPVHPTEAVTWHPNETTRPLSAIS